jgi:hypothetical protein
MQSYNTTVEWLTLCTSRTLIQFSCGVIFMRWYFLFMHMMMVFFISFNLVGDMLGITKRRGSIIKEE